MCCVCVNMFVFIVKRWMLGSLQSWCFRKVPSDFVLLHRQFDGVSLKKMISDGKDATNWDQIILAWAHVSEVGCKCTRTTRVTHVTSTWLLLTILPLHLLMKMSWQAWLNWWTHESLWSLRVSPCPINQSYTCSHACNTLDIMLTRTAFKNRNPRQNTMRWRLEGAFLRSGLVDVRMCACVVDTVRHHFLLIIEFSSFLGFLVFPFIFCSG